MAAMKAFYPYRDAMTKENVKKVLETLIDSIGEDKANLYVANLVKTTMKNFQNYNPWNFEDENVGLDYEVSEAEETKIMSSDIAGKVDMLFELYTENLDRVDKSPYSFYAQDRAEPAALAPAAYEDASEHSSTTPSDSSGSSSDSASDSGSGSGSGSSSSSSSSSSSDSASDSSSNTNP